MASPLPPFSSFLSRSFNNVVEERSGLRESSDCDDDDEMAMMQDKTQVSTNGLAGLGVGRREKGPKGSRDRGIEGWMILEEIKKPLLSLYLLLFGFLSSRCALICFVLF